MRAGAGLRDVSCSSNDTRAVLGGSEEAVPADRDGRGCGCGCGRRGGGQPGAVSAGGRRALVGVERCGRRGRAKGAWQLACYPARVGGHLPRRVREAEAEHVDEVTPAHEKGR